MTTEDIIVSGFVSVGSCAIYDIIKIHFIKVKNESNFFHLKISKIIRFVLAYILPIISLTLILSYKIELTFSNIFILIILCICIIYNILMSHIIGLYKMFSDLAKISSDKLGQIDGTFTKVHDHVEKIKRENNLK